ncbi:MAG: helix-turn-helix transcriptional regulator [Colwellia sp.]|nr:helix-turn-helix transcriptional regulator [Colwellia sp.]
MNSTNQLINWHESLAAVVAKNFSSEAIAELLKGLENLVDASSGLVTIFPLAQPPQTTHHRLLANENPQYQLDTYDSGAYLLDPFYRIALDKKVEGPFTVKDVSPEGFENSEYYDLFYKKLGFIDEICILFQFEDQAIVSISLVRHAGERPFTRAEVKQLEIVYPLIKSILVKWRQSLEHTAPPNLERQLENALINFGNSVLTPRESKIIHLILHGYSIKYIADKLDNSVETIKHHRKNIYTKLDVSSQSELFYLFIASLKAMPAGALVDPLTFLS